MGTLKDIFAYSKGFELAMEIFEISKTFPKIETYSLTDQIRRSSRSVCANLAEALKLSDADTENGETQTWLAFALACEYLSPIEHSELLRRSEEISKLIGYMINNPDKFIKLRITH